MYILTEELRTALLNYLASKPYQEVAQAIAALQSLPVAPVGKAG